MKQEEEIGNSESTATTDCVAALVVRIDFERFPELKRKVAELGGSVIFQRSRPPWVRLLIIEEGRER
jgi:hypothetical protein